jgi:flagellar biosynthesis/type III secretory pathway chaperone
MIGMVVVQADMRAVEALERIAAAQLVLAVVMVLIGLVVLGGVVAAVLQIRSARRTLLRSVEELKPQVAPVIERAKSVADDVAGMADDVRRRMDAVLHTVEELRRGVERGGQAVEQRLERFGAVLDIVQTEAEELMLDAAATAHGLHETARRLHGRAAERQRTEEEAAGHE